MLDYQLFGMNPAGHHLVNLLFHTANSLLLFLLLKNITGTIWRSVFVAAAFAWHPLHVESVAWVSERKDVLSAFFFILTLIAYTRFAQTSIKHQPSAINYCLALFFFMCGLMSKPMVVTLPFVLLLLDFWPLRRLTVSSSKFGIGTFQEVFSEKIPFFALAIIVCIVTFFAQKHGEEIMSLADASLPVRMENSLIACASYLFKIIWPANLAIFYPYSYSPNGALSFSCALLLLLCTSLFVLRVCRQPYLLVGWFWFLGTLVPTIGIVQVGFQAMADRYTYLPAIGMFILIVWSVADYFSSHLRVRPALPFLGGAALGTCLVLTSIQTRYWRNSITLASHAIEVTKDNYVAYDSIGRALIRTGKLNKSIPFFAEAARTGPHFLGAQINSALVLDAIGRSKEAVPYWRQATELNPSDPNLSCRLAEDLISAGQTNEAIVQFQKTLRLQPDYPDAKNALNSLFTSLPKPH
jgi:tetratricopeptide (TPR) repeat protein